MLPGRQRPTATTGPPAQLLAPAVVRSQAQEARGQRPDVAGFDEATLASVRDEVGQVARTPSDGGQTGRQRLAVHRAVGLGVARQCEHVGPGVQTRHLVARHDAVHDDSSGEVGPFEAGPHVAGVRLVDVMPTGQVQGDGVGRQRRDRLQQLEHALVGRPVADAQQRDVTAVPQAFGWWRRDGQIAAGLDHADTLSRQSVLEDEGLAERCAGRDEQAAAVVHEQVGRSLQPQCAPGPDRPHPVADAGRRRAAAAADRPSTQGATAHAAMLSTSTTSAGRDSGSRYGCTDTKSMTAPWLGAASAIRRWYR